MHWLGLLKYQSSWVPTVTYAGRPGGLVSTYNIFPDIQQKEMRLQQAGFPKGYLTERRRPLKMMKEARLGRWNCDDGPNGHIREYLRGVLSFGVTCGIPIPEIEESRR